MYDLELVQLQYATPPRQPIFQTARRLHLRPPWPIIDSGHTRNAETRLSQSLVFLQQEWRRGQSNQTQRSLTITKLARIGGWHGCSIMTKAAVDISLSSSAMQCIVHP